MATERMAFVENFKQLSSDTTMPTAVREERLSRLMSSVGLTQQQADSNAAALGNLGNTKAGNLIFNPLTKTFGGSKPGALGAIGRTGSVPTFVLAGVESGRQITFDGEPPGKTLKTNGEVWGVGALAGGGASAGASTLGAAGGPVTLLGVGVGVAASTTYGYFQDNTWEDFKHNSQEVGKESLDRYGSSLGRDAQGRAETSRFSPVIEVVNMPKFLQIAILLLLCVVGIAPLIVAPELAESNGFERSNGSTIGAFITMAWFGTMWWVSHKVARRQARRDLGQEVDHLLKPHRNTDEGNTDQGKHER